MIDGAKCKALSIGLTGNGRGAGFSDSGLEDLMDMALTDPPVAGAHAAAPGLTSIPGAPARPSAGRLYIVPAGACTMQVESTHGAGRKGHSA